MKRVLLAGGGTGGHLYPGLAVADRLTREGVECLFIGTRKGLESRVVPERGYPIRFIQARGLSLRPVALVKALASLSWGTFQSLRILASFRPQLVVGTGGYVSAPVVLAAALRGLPSVVLEQNAVPGKTTRLLGRLARRVCVSFEASADHLPSARVVVTGNPVAPEVLNADRAQARLSLSIPEGQPCLLVTGASQGARSLNEAVLKALPGWRERPWTIIHLTGPSHFEAVREQSQHVLSGSRLDYRPEGYRGEMAVAYAAADLVVGRAGATTIAEITARGLPSVLVPYPHAAEGHQEKNAEALVSRGGAVVVKDQEVGERLEALVVSLLDSPEKLAAMGAASARVGRPDALERIIEICREVTGRSA